MKLRIHKNSIRLRLSQTEIKTFAEEGKLIETLPFSNSSLTYALVLAEENMEQKEPTVDLKDTAVIVTVPHQMGKHWVNSDEVGFHNQAHAQDDMEQIRILVEKDFQCLHKRPHEDESDSFPNPLAE